MLLQLAPAHSGTRRAERANVTPRLATRTCHREPPPPDRGSPTTAGSREKRGRELPKDDAQVNVCGTRRIQADKGEREVAAAGPAAVASWRRAEETKVSLYLKAEMVNEKEVEGRNMGPQRGQRRQAEQEEAAGEEKVDRLRKGKERETLSIRKTRETKGDVFILGMGRGKPWVPVASLFFWMGEGMKNLLEIVLVRR